MASPQGGDDIAGASAPDSIEVYDRGKK